MSSRYVFPELFSGSIQAVKIGEKSRIGLRWMINSSIGLPKDLFEIWRFKGRIDHKRTAPTTEQGESGLIVSWPEGPCAAIELVLDVPVGAVSIRSVSYTHLDVYKRQLVSRLKKFLFKHLQIQT